MAAQLIDETEIIDVKCLCMVVFGPPGVGKTAICQTSESPLTLDFDRGAHRAFNRKPIMRFDTFRDVEAAAPEIAKRKTIIVDTVGRLLDTLTQDIIANNAKHGSASGGLSLQGFGVLKARFGHWMSQLRLAGKDVILICHEKEEKDGDDRIMRPDIQGGSYAEVHKVADMIGYLYRDRSGKRFLDFNPTDRHLGKNAAAWDCLTVPDLAENADYLGKLLADAKARIGRTAEASAAVAGEVDGYQKWLAGNPDMESVNGKLPALATVKPVAAKKQAWGLIEKYAADAGWTFDKTAKVFVGSAA